MLLPTSMITKEYVQSKLTNALIFVKACEKLLTSSPRLAVQVLVRFAMSILQVIHSAAQSLVHVVFNYYGSYTFNVFRHYGTPTHVSFLAPKRLPTLNNTVNSTV